MESSAMSIDSSGSSFLTNQNAGIIGMPCEFSELNLPSYRDVLKYYFFLSEREKEKSKKQQSYARFSPIIANKIIKIWEKINIALINRKSILKKLNTFLNKYHKEVKNISRGNTFSVFETSLNDVFYIGKCSCQKTIPCSCGLIPDALKAFMIDQHTSRQNTIPECVLNIVDQLSSELPATSDPSYRFDSSQMDVASEIEFAMPVAREPIMCKRGPYTKRYDTINFAMMCDRFGISDRVASCLATALFKDIDFTDENGEAIIMDKSKVGREKMKARESVRRMQNNDSTLLAFSFDGRKNDALTREEISGKYHPRVQKESHIVIVKEPGSKLLGHIKVDAEDSNTKQLQLCEFFKEKKLSITSLIGVCCDGEPTNTGTENGILRKFEVLLNKPLHWFVCLLHFNELPLRHLFNALEKSTTSGPRTASGALSKLIQTCEQLPALPDFEPILFGNMPPPLDAKDEKKLSTDVLYLLQIVKAVSEGSCPEHIASMKPGQIVHSRWLTTASRLLRLYVATSLPSKNLKILAKFIMKVYVPMYFNVKYYNSVVHGSALLYKFIKSTQFLPQNLREIVNKTIQNNAFFAHPENILLTMLFDERKLVRERAINKILYYREHLYDSTKVRPYKKHPINFSCTDYMDLVDLDNDNILSEPPFTASIPHEHLLEYIKSDDVPLADPGIPSHIQGTERCVQLLTHVSRRVIAKNRDDVMAVTLESRAQIPRMDCRKDLGSVL